MSHAPKLFIPVLALVLFVPFVSHAATTPNTQMLTIQAEIALLQQQVAQLEAALQASNLQVSSSTVQFTVPVTMHIDEGSGLRITFLGTEQTTTPVPASDPFSQPLGKFALNYSPCVTYYCTSSQYPTMTTELWPGESTHYLNYLITLNSLNTGSATVSVAKQ